MAEASGAPGPKAPRWAWWVATGFGSGYLKPAPGTWGSLAAVGVWFGITSLAWHGWFGWSEGCASGVLFIQLFLAPLVVIGIAIRASTLVSRQTGLKDPSFIVADEWAGIWVAFIPLILHTTLWTVPYAWQLARLLTPFLLFRIFDIWKPWPVHQLQALPEGTGIVMDDVVAGVYAAIPTFFIDGALLSWLHHRQIP